MTFRTACASDRSRRSRRRASRTWYSAVTTVNSSKRGSSCSSPIVIEMPGSSACACGAARRAPAAVSVSASSRRRRSAARELRLLGEHATPPQQDRRRLDGRQRSVEQLLAFLHEDVEQLADVLARRRCRAAAPDSDARISPRVRPARRSFSTRVTSAQRVVGDLARDFDEDVAHDAAVERAAPAAAARC